MEPYDLLEKAIEAATSETLQKPDETLLQEACALISSRSDMPKEAIKHIKKRMQTKNSKVIYLSLELLEMGTFICGLSFHTQISSKEFMMQLNNLILLKEHPGQVSDKLANLIRLWNQMFEPSRDLLPVYFEFVGKWEAKGHKFLGEYQSKYSKIRKSAVLNTVSPATDQGANKKKNEKLEQDLDIARQNLYLTNEIIDAHDHRDDVKRNDTLTDLMNTFKGLDEKLKDLIRSGDKLESGLMSFCLEFNDELMNTYKRYDCLEKKTKPQPFKKSSVFLKAPEIESTKEVPKSIVQTIEPPKQPEIKKLAPLMKPPQDNKKAVPVTSSLPINENVQESKILNSLIDISVSLPIANPQPEVKQQVASTADPNLSQVSFGAFGGQLPQQQTQHQPQQQAIQQSGLMTSQALSQSSNIQGSQVSFGVQSTIMNGSTGLQSSTQSAFFPNGSASSTQSSQVKQGSNIMNLYNQPVYGQGYNQEQMMGMMGQQGMGMQGMHMGMVGMNPMMMSGGMNPMMAGSVMNPMMASMGVNPMMAMGNPMMNSGMMGMMPGSFGFNNSQMMMGGMNSTINNSGGFGEMGGSLMQGLPKELDKVNNDNGKKPFDELDEMFAVKSKNNPGPHTGTSLI